MLFKMLLTRVTFEHNSFIRVTYKTFLNRPHVNMYLNEESINKLRTEIPHGRITLKTDQLKNVRIMSPAEKFNSL